MTSRPFFALVVALLSVAVPFAVTPLTESARFEADHRSLELLGTLLESAMAGLSDIERGAFIVRDGEEFALELWPRTLNKFKTSFEGKLPERLVALAHTHPMSRERPSRNDVAVAKRLRIDMYVITRLSIYRIAAATGEVTSLVRKRAWFDALSDTQLAFGRSIEEASQEHVRRASAPHALF